MTFQEPMIKDLQVEPGEEKRLSPRLKNSSPMHLYRMDCQDQSFYAEMTDYSQGGLSMMTNQKLVIGQLVYLEMKNHNISATGPEKYKSYSGSVKWAIPYSSCNDDKGPHNYGVEYSESVRIRFH